MRAFRATAAAVAAALLLTACGSGHRQGAKGAAGATSGHRARPPHRAGAVTPPVPASASQAAARLPLADQVAQLFLVALPGVTSDGELLAPVRAEAWGGFVLDRGNYQGALQLSSLAATIRDTSRAGGRLAPLIAAPQPGGPGTAFPDLPPQGEASVGSTALARSQATAAAQRLRALGLNATFAPLADVDNPQGPLSGKLFGQDPHAVARLSAAALAGYRSAGLVAIPPHFPGAGAATGDPDQVMATVGGTLADLARRDLVPFRALARDAPAIQLSNALYAAFDGVTPATLLPEAVAVLRDRLRFRGVIVSGDLDAAAQATGGTEVGAAVAALRAGADLLYVSGSPALEQRAYAAVLDAVRRGHVSRARVRDALLRVLALKARYGLL